MKKIRDYVAELKKCDARIPVIAVDKTGRECPVSRDFFDDGPDWEQFTLILLYKDQPELDTDMAKMLLDYAYNDPERLRARSLFTDETPFLNYELRVARPAGREMEQVGAWATRSVTRIYVRETDDAEKMVLELEGPSFYDETEK